MQASEKQSGETFSVTLELQMTGLFSVLGTDEPFNTSTSLPHEF